MRYESQQNLCDKASEAEVEADQSIARAGFQHPKIREKAVQTRVEDEMKYLMWPLKGTKKAVDSESEIMICIQRQEQLNVKVALQYAT